jgi:hypothetical protein
MFLSGRHVTFARRETLRRVSARPRRRGTRLDAAGCCLAGWSASGLSTVPDPLTLL